ncbi:hypothetical protein G167_gp55 [Burkholderia phage BcepMigl]|uniref:Uncharacterized protein n=1 Tax=Burkholderia phage BcepMigl TaxID=2886899 RepID=I6XKU5_9CAUD|nr:hypothetical protein G167_gp55 [Burkholderia phage BcepMigl]AFN39099.1 hypothetical protein BcepMigl_gp30 [Burkholderia phage BcepMigl]
MNRTEYRSARRLIRDNGRFALRWLPAEQRDAMDRIITERDSTDPLAERADIIAYCAREGIACNVRHTAPRRAYDGSYVENHCPECGEYDSECACESHESWLARRDAADEARADDHRA